MPSQVARILYCNIQQQKASRKEALGQGLTCESLTQEVDECVVVHGIKLDQVLWEHKQQMVTMATQAANGNHVF